MAVPTADQAHIAENRLLQAGAIESSWAAMDPLWFAAALEGSRAAARCPARIARFSVRPPRSGVMLNNGCDIIDATMVNP
jgi:hypothetical protein